MLNIPIREKRGYSMLEQMKNLDKSSPLPLYYQLQENLLNMIKRKEITPGERIPSERKLCEYLDISRMTVHKAVEHLVREGYLYREHGKGTFIAEKRKENKISPFQSFTEEIEKKGLSSRTILKDITLIDGDRKICHQLRVEDGSAIYKVERLRLLEGTPFLWEIVYLPSDICPNLEEEIEDSSLYSLLENSYELNLDYAEATVEPVIIPDNIAHKLELDSDELGLLFHQLTLLKDGRPIEWTRAYYRSNSYKFKLKFGQNF